jgi:coproporphyrinogen III oxidase-like Fe-S oxidoreductase
MRTLRGLPLSEAAPWEDDLRDLQYKGLVSLDGGRWLLTPRGRLLADSVAEIFI